MKENEINTIITNSFKSTGYFAHKIADPIRGTGIQNPFDIFAVIKVPVYIETKLLKGYKAFNFHKIEDHQIVNLSLIKKFLPQAECLIILAIWESRKFLDFIIFDIQTILTKMEKSVSYRKVELLKFKEDGYVTSLVKGKKVFDIEVALSKKL